MKNDNIDIYCTANWPKIKRRILIGSLSDPNFAIIASSFPTGKWSSEALMTEPCNSDHKNRPLTNCFRRIACPNNVQKKAVCCSA